MAGLGGMIEEEGPVDIADTATVGALEDTTTCCCRNPPPTDKECCCCGNGCVGSDGGFCCSCLGCTGCWGSRNDDGNEGVGGCSVGAVDIGELMMAVDTAGGSFPTWDIAGGRTPSMVSSWIANDCWRYGRLRFKNGTRQGWGDELSSLCSLVVKSSGSTRPSIKP